MRLKLIALPLIAATISGCSLLPLAPREVEIITKPVEIEITQPLLPRQLSLKTPQWYVVSDKNLDEFLARIEKEAGGVVFFAMSPGDYELMAYNIQEIRRYVKEMNEVVVYYRTVTTKKGREDVQQETQPE